ncbi:MAG: SH3 domain-containing protein, partial [Clostridium sp.]
MYKKFTDLSTQPSWNGLNEKENLNSGTTIQIIVMQNGWCEFNYDGGSGESTETRWVPSTIVEIMGETPSQGIIENSTTGTAVQSGASWDNTTYLGMLKNGDYVSILDVVNGWYKINFNGKPGYIPVYRVNIQQLGCIKQFTDLSTQPSWNGLNEKENLNSGTTIQIIGMQNGWYEFNYDGGSGEASETRWVPSSIVELTGGIPSQGIIEYLATGTSVQSGASWSDATYLGMLNNGDYVNILGVVNGWYKINFNGKLGYIPVYRVNIQQLGCIKQFTDLSTQPSWNGLNEKE